MPHIFSIGGIVSQLMLAPKTVCDGKMSAEIGAGIPQPRVQEEAPHEL